MLGPEAEASGTAAYGQLADLIARAKEAGGLGDYSVGEATLLWDALAPGLALREICGPIRAADGERIWTDALEAFLAGLGRDRTAGAIPGLNLDPVGSSSDCHRRHVAESPAVRGHAQCLYKLSV